MSLSDTAYELMDELFFVIAYAELCKQVEFTDQEVKSGLTELLQAGWVDQLEIPENELDFVKREAHNLEYLENFSYLATKKGLLIYNGVLHEGD